MGEQTRGKIAHGRGRTGWARGVYWRTPIFMFFSLILGIVLVVVHHIFYNSLNGTVVQDSTQQTWNIRIGTGLAFVIKMCLTAAVSIACVQNLWWLLHRKPVEINTLNSFFNILENGWSLLNYRAWLRGPLVAFLAVIAWAIPLAAVVTPATLTVQLAPDMAETSRLQAIPTIDWSKENAMYSLGRGSISRADGDLSRIGLAIASTSSIISLHAPEPNSSYTLNFYAPALKCADVNDTVMATLKPYWLKTSFNYYAFVSFVPHSSNLSRSLETSLPQTTSSTDPSITNMYAPDHARIYFATGNNSGLYAAECGFFNSSYTVEFKFDNGEQKLTVRNLTYGGGIFPPLTYQNNVSQSQELNLYRNYWSMVDAYAQLFGGTLQWGIAGTQVYKTQVLMTSLVNSKEMADWNWASKFATTKFANNRVLTMIEGVEEIFRNFTLSLFAFSDYLTLQNETALTKVSIYHPQTKYVYMPRNLWISYGLAIFFAAFGAFIGVLALFLNDASFTNSFSSLLRVTRNPNLALAIRPEDTDGSEPLPEYLTRIKLSMTESVRPDGQPYCSLDLTAPPQNKPSTFQYQQVQNK